MIYIQPLNVKWDPGRQMMNRPEFAGLDFSRFQMYICQRYQMNVIMAVKRQTLAKRWAPLSSGYFNFKISKGYSLNIWEATGYLMAKLSYWHTGQEWTVGFNKRYRHPHSKTPLLVIARSLEFGTASIPPRPLFGAVYRFMSKSMIDYMRKFAAGGR